MFTGLIETVCKVGSSASKAGGIRLTINLGWDVKCGDSIAVNGVCLTVASLKGTAAEFDVSTETLSKATLGKLKAGSEVNIERALKADDRFGGHFVQGHIDAIGKVKKIEKKGDFWMYAFEVGKEISDFLVPKGSIAVDGVSLTIVDAQEQNFSAAVIPATFQNTIFKNYKVGDIVNVETDIICRMVKKQLDNISASAKAMADRLGQKQGLTVEKLKEMGF
jgi:riboflavin synthase